jgi:signal peptidase I
MAPTLAPGDLLLASHVRRPGPGAVVVVDSPDGRVLLKRAVAGPGSEVDLDHGDLVIDGALWPGVLDVPGAGHWSVPDAHWFVLSDAPDRTMADSRSFGPVAVALIRGVVVARLWPSPGRID